MKVLLHQVDQLLMGDSAGTADHDILTEIVALMEVSDHLSVNFTDVVDVSEDGLSHHMIPVDIEVDIFHQSFLWVLVDGFKLLPDRVLLKL